MAEGPRDDDGETPERDDPSVLAEGVRRTDRREILLDCLREFDEPVTLPDLADEIAVRECETEITDIPGELVKEIYLSLYHTHVPSLAHAGLLEYDQEDDLVAVAPDVDLDRLLRETGVE